VTLVLLAGICCGGLSPAGDFNGDGVIDVAVANRSAGSVSVYLNNGTGQLSRSDVPGVGSEPTDIDAACFNSDELHDLAIALSGDKALVVMTASEGGSFDAGQAQRIYFQNMPSALQAENFDGLHQADVLVGFSDFGKLALCTSDGEGSMTYAYSIDTIADVIVAPDSGVVLSEDNILNVAGGTGAGGVSSLDGVASVAQHGYKILHLPQSQNISFSVVTIA